MPVLVGGLFESLQIALMALAIALVHRSARVLHLGLAGVIVIAPFVVKDLVAIGAHPALAWAGAIAVGSSLSAAIGAINHERLIRRNAGESVHLIAALGLYIAIEQAVSLRWGDAPEVLREGASSSVTIGPVVSSVAQILCAAVTAGAVGATLVVLHATRWGILLRAMAANAAALESTGQRTDRIRLAAFAAAGALGSLGALAAAYDIGFDAHSGLDTVLIAIAAGIVGGRASFIGPIVGGFTLGMVRAVVGWGLSAGWRQAASFALLGFFLLLRPEGLVRRHSRLEAET